MPVDPQLINVFGDDLGDILTALEEGINPQVQQLMAESISNLQFDAKIFGNQIQKQVNMLTGAGLDEKAIKTILSEDLRKGGRIFGELKNNIKAATISSINLSSRLGQYQNYDLDKGQFAWITVGGHKICPDCEEREGIIMNFNNWEMAGLPGSGWSVCQGYCYCILDPTGEIKTKIDVDVDKRS